MTARALAGLGLLNLMFLGVGASVLWALRGWRSWGEFARLAGTAYFLGIASMIALLAFELVVGIGFSGISLIATGACVVSVCVLIGRHRKRSLRGVRFRNWRFGRLSFSAALWTAGIAVYFEALFRVSRFAPVGEWDAWWLWTVRAKALYYFGDLGGAELVRSSLWSYPPGLSLVQAAAFEAMGKTDAVTLHVQHWFLALGFVVAITGLLRGRVRSAVLFPFVTLLLAMPVFVTWSTILYADLLLSFQAAIAALLLVFWLEKREAWPLWCATLLLGSALLTKREGVVSVLCLLLASAAASWHERGWAWPRLAAASGAAAIVALPWWVGVATASGGGGPSEGFSSALDQLDRLVPSLRLVVSVYLDEGLTLGIAILATIGVLIAAATKTTREAIFLSTYLLAFVGASSVVIASEPLLAFSRLPDVNPVERVVMVSLVVLIPLTALIFEAILRSFSGERDAGLEFLDSAPPLATNWRAVAAWAVLAAAVLAYPASVLVSA